ncbi:MAG: DUF3253 domain-containing protein [Acidimicrobiales bacterium]|nr:DUF3253 domain-containing protein [Acidimicrobiales bacterium]
MEHDGVERTEDGRWIVVDGRRWRASDPSIPGPLRQELVDELMAARREVAAGEPDARGRVQHAKVALGERGEPWWEPGTDEGRRGRIRAVVLALTARRAPSGSICPSDVARTGGTSWRGLMDNVRAEVRALATRARWRSFSGGSPST